MMMYDDVYIPHRIGVCVDTVVVIVGLELMMKAVLW